MTLFTGRPPRIFSLTGLLTATLAAGALVAGSPIAARAAAPDPASIRNTAVAGPVYAPGSGPRRVVNDLRTGGDSTVRDYWTAERIARAIPADTPAADAEVSGRIDALRRESSPRGRYPSGRARRLGIYEGRGATHHQLLEGERKSVLPQCR